MILYFIILYYITLYRYDIIYSYTNSYNNSYCITILQHVNVIVSLLSSLLQVIVAEANHYYAEAQEATMNLEIYIFHNMSYIKTTNYVNLDILLQYIKICAEAKVRRDENVAGGEVRHAVGESRLAP